MKKSQLKEIIRECIEEIYLDEKRGKKGVRPSNKSLERDISDFTTSLYTDDQKEFDAGTRAARRAMKHGSIKHLNKAVSKYSNTGKNSGPGRGWDALALRTPAPPAKRSGPRKGKIDKTHIEKLKTQAGQKFKNHTFKGKLPK